MEQPTTNRPMQDYPRTPDGKYKYTARDGSPRYFEQMILPSMGLGIPGLIPYLRKRFKRGSKEA